VKFWMLSPRILALPTNVRTLSSVVKFVTNSPISSTVPRMPRAEMKSPTLKGRRMRRKTPAARLARRPLHAAPMAMPTPARRAAKLVVSMPKKPRMAMMRAMLRMTATAVPM